MIKKNSGILIVLFTILISGFFIFKPAIAEDAALLPNGVQQFFDNSGKPLSSGKIYFYEVGTTTFKDTYTSSEADTINPNPITLNAGGKAPTGGIYGIGLYRQLVKDRNGNTIWDAVTAPGGGGSTPENIGDGNLVGTILPWSGLIAPNQYVFAYGQELDRSDYPEFYTAITLQLNVICTSSSNILTGLSDTSQIPIGSSLELALCVPAGSTVVSKTTSTVTLSNPSSVTLNAVATFFPWGNGDGSTTFNVPDLRDVVLAGRPNMGGSDRGLLSSTYYGTSPTALAALGGTQSITLSQSNLPTVYMTTNIASGQGSHSHTAKVSSQGANTTNSGGYAIGQGTFYINTITDTLLRSDTIVASTLPAMTGSTVLSGNNVPFSTIQPTSTVNYIIKVTPDTSISIATGVYSIGGMTGIISCGTGILCTGNILNLNGAPLTKNDDTNVTLTLGGSPNGSMISPVSLTLGWTGQLSLNRGGTNNSLTASNGGIVWSDSSKLNVLSGTITANQVLLSGASATPAWSNATYPTSAPIGTVLNTSSTNAITATNNPVLGDNAGLGGQFTLKGATSGSVNLKVASAAGTGTVFQLPASNGSNGFVLKTDGSGVTTWEANTTSSLNGLTYSTANADGQFITNGTMTSGGSTLYSASATFDSSDVGKVIQCGGTASAGGLSSGTITSYISAASITTSFTAGTSITGSAKCQWGTDNTTTINSEIAALTSGGTLMLPAGNILVSSINMTNAYSTSLIGVACGINASNKGTVLVPTASSNNRAVIDMLGAGGSTIRCMQIGTTQSPVAPGSAILIGNSNTQTATLLQIDRVFATSTFQNAAIYIYGLQDSLITYSQIWNYNQTLYGQTSGQVVFYLTRDNQFSMGSNYTTIATGSQPTSNVTLMKIEAHDYKPSGGATSGVALYQRGASLISVTDSILDSSTNAVGIVTFEQSTDGTNPFRNLHANNTYYNENGTSATTCLYVNGGVVDTMTILNPSYTCTATRFGTINYSGFSTP